MTEDQHNANQVSDKSGPETCVNIGNNSDGQENKTQHQSIANNSIVKLHSSEMDGKVKENRLAC
jgi:hypothetical protein